MSSASNAYERMMLRRAAAWEDHPSWRGLSVEVLREVAEREGIDFATALVYDRLLGSPEHGPFIERVRSAATDGRRGRQPGLLAIVPGVGYVEFPQTGADGRRLREGAEGWGWRVETVSRSPASAALARQRPGDSPTGSPAGPRSSGSCWSRSAKAGRTSRPPWPARRRPAASAEWASGSISSGILEGTAIANWTSAQRRCGYRRFVRFLFWWKPAGAGVSTARTRGQLDRGPAARSGGRCRIPAREMCVVHVVGIPLSCHLRSKRARRGHRRLAGYGPNDGGGILLGDLCRLPGRIYPVWGQDHLPRAGLGRPSLDPRILHAALESGCETRRRRTACWRQGGLRTTSRRDLAGPVGKRRHRHEDPLRAAAGRCRSTATGTGIFKTSLRYAPLTLTTLAAMVPAELNADVTIQDEGVQPLELDFDADLVGITAITGTALRAYRIADELRAKGRTIVLGGVHATLLPDEAAQHADAIVVGYAEQSWPQLLRDFSRGEMKSRYFTPTGRSLAGIPHARRDLLKKSKYATVNSIEATRGCPHKCDFCAVPTAWSKTYAHRPVADVVAELRTFEGRHAVFIDLSPVEDVAYAKALYAAMIPLRFRWVGLATTRIAEDAELLGLAARSGCKGLLIGFESISQSTLEETRKGFHQACNYQDVVKKLHDHGIGIQGCFVFGFDNDDTSVFERTVEFVDRVKIDLPRYAVMTPFPGTGYYGRLEAEGRLLHKDWSLYDVEHVVFQPRQMSPERLQEGMEWAWRQSYAWKSMFTRIAGSRCVLPLSASLNLGYRYYARHLHEKTGPIVHRDPAYIAEAQARRHAGPAGAEAEQAVDDHAILRCRRASEANFVELGIL